MQKIPVKIFEQFKNLDQLEAKHVGISSLDNLDFDETKLTVLNLEGNNIRKLEPGYFNNFKNLESLYLNENKISTIGEHTFDNLTSLKVLSLKNNSISNIANSTFKENRKLENLYLDFNKIHTINSKTFEGLENLHELVISNNSIRSISNQSFKDLNNLRILHLGSNNLVVFNQETLEGLNSLTFLNMSDNRIETVDFYHFKATPDLEELFLVNNYIKTISCNKTAEDEEHNSLRSINLDENRLRSLSEDVFAYFVNIEELSIRENQLNSIDKKTFMGLRALQKLTLPNNHIKIRNYEDSQGFFNETKALKVLNLTCNEIMYINVYFFKDLDHLKELILSNNHIIAIHREAFKDLISLENLDLSFNSIVSGYSDWFRNKKSLKVISFAKNDFQCINDMFQEAKSLEQLDLGHNKLRYIDFLWFSKLKNLNTFKLNSNDLFRLKNYNVTSNFKKLENFDLTNNECINEILNSTQHQDLVNIFKNCSGQTSENKMETECLEVTFVVMSMLELILIACLIAIILRYQYRDNYATVVGSAEYYTTNSFGKPSTGYSGNSGPSGKINFTDEAEYCDTIDAIKTDTTVINNSLYSAVNKRESSDSNVIEVDSAHGTMENSNNTPTHSLPGYTTS